MLILTLLKAEGTRHPCCGDMVLIYELNNKTNTQKLTNDFGKLLDIGLLT